MKTHIISLALLVLASLACTAQAAGNQAPPVSVISTVDTSSVKMVVTGDLWVRPAPGDLGRALGELHTGELVQCVEFTVSGDTVWCRHEAGWSNVKYLKAVTNVK